MAEPSNDPKSDPISVNVCDERSKRIEEKVDSGIAALKLALEKVDLRLETVVNEHDHRLQDQRSAIERISQTLAERDQAKERNYKRTTLWIAVIAIAVSLFSNLEKIIAALR